MLSSHQHNNNGGAVMRKSLFASILMVLIGGFFASSVMADDTLVRFQGGIGDIPVSNVAGTANPPGTLPNMTPDNVRPVHPPRPNWGVAPLSADRKDDRRGPRHRPGPPRGRGNAI